jgi:preprotein translocase subunit SecF
MDIIGKKWLYFLFSGLIILPGLISLALWGVRPAIDFSGGTLIEVQSPRFKVQSEKDELKKIIEAQKIEIGSITHSGDDSYLLRLKPIDKSQNDKLQEEMVKQFGEIKEIRFETVGPSIGRETTENAIKAVIVASVAIILYIAFAFRTVPKPYSSLKFGICAVMALIHDVLVIVGLFSLFGHYFKVEIDSLFITALLTIMGFSVHDTIVVFDRIRENLKKMPNSSFATVVNESIIQTLARSLSTTLTVLFTLLALFLFGGESIRWFVVALLIGITSGTYSSIFNAAPLLVVWEEKTHRKSI